MTKQELQEKILSLKSSNGGWSKESLALLGVAWPPPKGWQRALIEECND